MKRLSKLLLCLVLLLALCACSENETANIALFAERYNASGGEKLSYSLMSAVERENVTEYSFVSSSDEAGGKKVLVKVFANENKKLFECRLVISKTDGKNKVTLTEADIDRFINSCEKTFCAFSGFGEEKSRSVISALEIRENCSSPCEKTVREGEYYVVFLSNEVCFEVMFCNTYLKKIEETQKPESRAVYDMTTNTRTETVPHK